MSIDVSLVVDVTGLEAKLKEGLEPLVRAACKQIAHNMLPKVVELVGQGIRASPEFESLASGKLREQFGLGTEAGGVVEGRDAAEAVVVSVQESIRVDTLPPEGNSYGGVFVGAFRDDFSDAMSSRFAEYISISKKGETLVPWLKWLLFAGDAIVLTGVELLDDYPTRKVSSRQASRTGKVIMVRRNYDTTSSSGRSGGSHAAFGRYHAGLGRTGPGSWSVPAEFAGSAQANWLSRVAESIAPRLTSLLEEEGRAFRG